MDNTLENLFRGLAGQPTLSNAHAQREAPDSHHLNWQPQGSDAVYTQDVQNLVTNGQAQEITGTMTQFTPNTVHKGFDNAGQATNWQQESGRAHTPTSGMAGNMLGASFGIQPHHGAFVWPFQGPGSRPALYPNFTQAGHAPATAPGYAYNVNDQSPSFSMQAPTARIGGALHHGHPHAQAMTGGLFHSGTYHGQRGLNTNNVDLSFPHPFPSQPIFNQDAYQGGHRVGEPHVVRQQQPTSRFSPYARRTIQPSTATTFLGARSYNPVNSESSNYAPHQLGSGGGYDAQNPHFPRQHAMSTPHFQPPYQSQYTPQYSSSTFSPEQRMDHCLTPYQEHQPPYASMPKPMASSDSGHHQPHTGALQNQGATWQAPGEGAQFSVPHGARGTLYQGIPQSNVSNLHHWRVETTQKPEFDQVIDTGNLASSEHRLVERLQLNQGQNGQSSLSVPSGSYRTINMTEPHAVTSADVQELAYAYPTPITERQDTHNHLNFGSQNPVFEGQRYALMFGPSEPRLTIASSGTPSEEFEHVQNPDDGRGMGGYMNTVASADVEELGHPMPTMECQEAATHLAVIPQDPTGEGSVPHSSSSSPLEQESPSGDGGSQQDPEGAQPSNCAPSLASREPSLPADDDEGNNVDLDQESGEDGSKGEEDSEEGEEGTVKDGEDQEDQDEDEKMIMCKVTIQHGWYMYKFLRPERGFVFYHGPPPGTY